MTVQFPACLEALTPQCLDAGLDELGLRDMTFDPRLGNLSPVTQRGWPLFHRTRRRHRSSRHERRRRARLVDMMGSAKLTSTFVHGDAKPGNVVLPGDHGVALLAGGRVRPPCWHGTYAMINALTTEDRPAHEAEFLDAQPHDLTGYRHALIVGLVVAAALTLLGDASHPRPRELIRTVVARSGTALQDHGLA